MIMDDIIIVKADIVKIEVIIIVIIIIQMIICLVADIIIWKIENTNIIYLLVFFY